MTQTDSSEVPAHAVSLNALQSYLQQLYELDVDHEVSGFLTSSVAAGESEHARSLPDEALLLREDADGLAMSLYLAPELLRTLESDDPMTHLWSGNLNAFCQVLEGVSHFLYVAWRAGFDRSVSRLEMELQAEVDKYVAATLLLNRQRGRRVSPGLRHLLFDAVQFHADLGAHEARRYRDANAYASKLCAGLERRYPRRLAEHPDALRDLRRFYRLGEQGKRDWIDALA